MVCLSRGKIISPGFQEGGLIVDRFAQDNAVSSCEAPLLDFAEREALHKLVDDVLIKGGVVFCLRLAEVMESTRDDDQESPGRLCCVAF